MLHFASLLSVNWESRVTRNTTYSSKLRGTLPEPACRAQTLVHTVTKSRGAYAMNTGRRASEHACPIIDTHTFKHTHTPLTGNTFVHPDVPWASPEDEGDTHIALTYPLFVVEVHSLLHEPNGLGEESRAVSHLPTSPVMTLLHPWDCWAVVLGSVRV